MDVDIVPEPTEAERRAILLALRLTPSEGPVPSSRWGAGLGSDCEEDQAGARPLQRPGAARA
jgi:hypothetical protein